MKKLFNVVFMLFFIGCVNNPPTKQSLKQLSNKKNNNFINNVIRRETKEKFNYEKSRDEVSKNVDYIEVNKSIANNFNYSQKFNNTNRDKNFTKILSSFSKREPLKKISKVYKVQHSHILYINLGPIVHFDTDKYKIKKEYLPKLDKIINELKECNCSILVVGHTDSRGSDRYNQALSELRAREVYKYMIQRGINKNRLDYIGYGEEQPLTTNATPSGRAINRRVELLVGKDLNISFSFLRNREINSSYWNNHNIKTAGKIEFTQKGWTKKLQPSQIKNILIYS